MQLTAGCEHEVEKSSPNMLRPLLSPRAFQLP